MLKKCVRCGEDKKYFVGTYFIMNSDEGGESSSTVQMFDTTSPPPPHLLPNIDAKEIHPVCKDCMPRFLTIDGKKSYRI